MPVVKENGREIVLERVDGKLVKRQIPQDILEALDAVPLDMRVDLLVRATSQYRLTSDQFELVIARASFRQWILLAKGLGTWRDIWNRIVVLTESDPASWDAALDYALHFGWSRVAFEFVRDHISRPEIHASTRNRFWEYVKEVCLQKLRSRYELNADERTLIQEYVKMHDEEYCRSRNLIRIEIAAAINAPEALRSLWLEVLTREASVCKGDDSLEKLCREAVRQLPACKDELFATAIESLAGKGKKFLAGNLANNLGVTERSKQLYLEARAERLKSENPFAGLDKSRVGDCSYLIGEHEVAYGYYLMVDDTYGMFKAAWEFDRAKAMEIAREIADEAIKDPYYALNGALAIAMQAGLPEAQQVYEKGIERLEQNAALELALKFAEEYGDVVRIQRYQLLLDL